MSYTQLKVAIISHDITWGDKEDNIITVAEHLSKIDPDTDVVVLPELFSTGFVSTTEHLYEMSETESGASIVNLIRWAQFFGVAICGSYLAKEGLTYCNRAFFVEPTGEITYYDKRHLNSSNSEEKCYARGKEQSPIIRYRGWNISMLVCFDIYFPVWCRNVKNKIDLMLVPANWPKERENIWEHLLIARAIENQYYVVGANRSGVDDVGNYNSSIVVNYNGDIISKASNKSSKIAYAILDKKQLGLYREQYAINMEADTFKLIDEL